MNFVIESAAYGTLVHAPEVNLTFAKETAEEVLAA